MENRTSRISNKSSPKLKYIPDFSVSKNKKHCYKYIGSLGIIQGPHPLRRQRIRSLKQVKYIVNLRHETHPHNKTLNSMLSHRRNYMGTVTIHHVEQKLYFLKKVRFIRDLELRSTHDEISRYSRRLEQAIKRLGNPRIIRFNMENDTLQFKDLEQILKTYSRRNVYGFKVEAVDYTPVDFYNLQLTKLKNLIVRGMHCTLLSIMLIKARAFENLEILNLGILQIEEETCPTLFRNFALFQKLEFLCLKVRLLHQENSYQWLKNFQLGSAMKFLNITLTDIVFPDLFNLEDNGSAAFESFAKNLRSAYKLEELSLTFSVRSNFQGLNKMNQCLPECFTEMKKLWLDIRVQKGKTTQYEDTRVIMRELFKWTFSMPKLEEFYLDAVDRDFTGLSHLEIPRNLKWKVIDLLQWPEESQDTLKPDDLAAFLQILKNSHEIECLKLSIESSHFDLEAFKQFSQSFKVINSLKHLDLKLNCRQFSIYDFGILEPCLKELDKLETLSLMFIYHAISETEVWKYRLCKTFEYYQKLKNFNLSLFALSQQVMVRNYYLNTLKSKEAMNFQRGRNNY